MAIVDKISRRSFLGGLSSLFTGVKIIAKHGQLEHIVSSTQPEQKSITFEEAADSEDPILRQEYINQLVKRIGKPNGALEVIYDHDGSLSKKSEEEKWNFVFNDPKLFNLHLREFLEVYLKPEEREKARETILNTKEGREGFRQYLLSAIPENSAGYTNSRKSPSIGNRATVYLTKKVFEEWKLADITKDVPYGKSEEILIGILQHEYSHAEDIFNGLPLGDRMRLDNLNILETHPLVLGFVSDVKAQLMAIDYVKNNFGKEHKAYAFMLHKLSNEVTEFNIFISHIRGRLNPTKIDNLAYDFYFQKLNEALDEARKILGK